MVRLLLLGLLLLTACIGERTKVEGNSKFDTVAPMSRDAERQHILEQGKDFCARYQDDKVCQPQKR